MGFFKSFSRKVSHQSRFESAPKLDHQLVNINNDCLEIKGYLAESYLAMGWIGAWTFLIMGVPLLIFAISQDILFPLINGFKNSTHLFQWALFFFGTIFFTTGLTLGWSWLNLKTLKKSSLIRFNRHTQKVYATILGHECEADWRNVKAEFAVQRMVYGAVVETRDVVRIHMKDTKNQKHGYAAVIEATYSLDTKDDGCEMVWEFIRRFMFEGPDNLPIIPNNRLDDMGRFQQISYPPRQAFKRRWFWPIYTANDPKDVKWMHIIFWPVKVVLFIPNLLADFLWHWMVQKLGGGFAQLPEHTLEGCSNIWITPLNLNHVIKNNEKYLIFSEASKRLAFNSTSV